MKHYITLLLTLLVPAFAFAQEYDKYQSREEDEYNKNYKYKHFEPMTEDQIKHYKNEFFDFERIEDYTPYNDSIWFTTYQDSVIKTEMRIRTSGKEQVFKKQCVGKIDKRFILKYEKKGKIEAYPCGISVKESRKMLNELPEFREVVAKFVPPKKSLRSILEKGTTTSQHRTGGRG